MAKKREYAFDILKFAAIAIIVLHHYQQVTGARFDAGANWYHGAFYWGFLVELFFIISGYFACSSIGRIKAGQSFLVFYAGKYLRFLPMIFICGIAYLFTRGAYEVLQGSGDIVPFTFWDVLASLTGFERWFSGALMVNNPMWYVSVLLLCFVAFFIVVAAVKERHLPLAFGVVIAIGLTMRVVCAEYDVSVPFVNASIARGLICFFLGINLALIIARFPQLCEWRTLIVSCAVVVLFIAVYIVSPSHVYESNRDPLYYSLVFAVYPCIVFILKNRVVASLFTSDKLKFLGGAAYNMYVWHAPLIYLYMIVFAFVDLNPERQIAMYAFLVLCFFIGVISDRLIDSPLARRITPILETLKRS